MGSVYFDVLPQSTITVRAGAKLPIAAVVAVDSFGQIVVELTLGSPPGLATNALKLYVKTANTELPEAGWAAYTPKTITGVVTAGTPFIGRAVWRRDDAEPLLRLVAFEFENDSGADLTLAARIGVLGTGCGGCR